MDPVLTGVILTGCAIIFFFWMLAVEQWLFRSLLFVAALLCMYGVFTLIQMPPWLVYLFSAGVFGYAGITTLGIKKTGNRIVAVIMLVIAIVAAIAFVGALFGLSLFGDFWVWFSSLWTNMGVWIGDMFNSAGNATT